MPIFVKANVPGEDSQKLWLWGPEWSRLGRLPKAYPLNRTATYLSFSNPNIYHGSSKSSNQCTCMCSTLRISRTSSMPISSKWQIEKIYIAFIVVVGGCGFPPMPLQLLPNIGISGLQKSSMPKWSLFLAMGLSQYHLPCRASEPQWASRSAKKQTWDRRSLVQLSRHQRYQKHQCLIMTIICAITSKINHKLS